ncbi:MAG: hypothetical protein DDT25_00061 [Chloroflexi bacterium]|nr:hypothetical protein [Chloroflexota bacterium]
MKSNDAIGSVEQDVLQDATDDFMNAAMKGGSVLDVKPVPPREKKGKWDASKGKKLAFAGIAVLAVGLAVIGIMAGGAGSVPSSPPAALVAAEADDVDATERVASPPAPEPQAVPEFFPSATVAQEVGPPEVGLLAADNSVPVSGSAPEPVAVVAAEPASMPVGAGAPAPAQEPAAPVPAVLLSAVPVPMESLPADTAEIARLKSEIAALRRATPRPVPPTRIEVEAVLEDGVVLRAPDGRTIIVPAGSGLTAANGRIEEIRR